MKEKSIELKKAKKKVGSLESELKKAKLELATIEQLKVDLAVAEQAWDASYMAATQAQNKVVAIEARLTEL